jgi:methionine synthase II (cobalamin-independent)
MWDTHIMAPAFYPDSRPLLIGSLPLTDHEEALQWVLSHTPDLPLWVQLPAYSQEGMIPQFLPGLPGVKRVDGRSCVDTAADDFDAAMLAFFERYLALSEALNADISEEGLPEAQQGLAASEFALTPEIAGGFFTLQAYLRAQSRLPRAVKGQITGPVTFCTGVKDQEGRAIFYNEAVREAAIKLLALKAAWQTQALGEHGCPVIVFIDEPALAGYGSSELISISREETIACLGEVVAAIHAQGGLAGIHVCANTDWSLVIDSGVDIVNFDAYAYFDRFLLYPDQVKAFVEKGGLLALGVVPTLKPEEIDAESVASLYQGWQTRMDQLAALGLDRERLFRQSLVTPSCGTGSLDRPHALRVLELTRDLSQRVRVAHGENG